MGDPWSRLCTRSPDGQKIAFIELPDIPIYALQGIYWFSLKNPQEVHTLLSNGTVASDVAFSPDSRYLAYFGCGGQDENCGVYIYDTQTLKIENSLLRQLQDTLPGVRMVSIWRWLQQRVSQI